MLLNPYLSCRFQNEVQHWKRQHRKVYRVDIADSDETHTAYFRRPDFDTVKAVAKIAKADEVQAGKVMMDNCWLGGSEEMRRDAVLFMAAQAQLAKLLNGCVGSLKNA